MRHSIAPGRPLRDGVLLLSLIALLVSMALPVGVDAAETEGEDALPAAVAAPNVRLGVHYGYLRLEKTESYSSITTSTLSIGHLEGHRGNAEIIGAFPIYGPVGGRAWLRGAYGHSQKSLDGLERGNNELSILGLGGALLVRNPEVGEISAGGGWDRIARSGPIDANAYEANVALSAFYPDMGLGPVDWRVDLQYRYTDVTGISGPVDYDADHYFVSGEAGWYARPDLRIALGGRWKRLEAEFSSETDSEGFVQVRTWLPRAWTFSLPVELSFGGSGGVSEYKQSPFRTDRRPVWTANVGFVFRYGSGATLLEAVRAYD
jgi:opacity protein-like surface antigen